MRVISVNVGLPRNVEWDGKLVRTSIWKEPVMGRVRVGLVNLDGDQQSDLTVHGGVTKSVYAYPSEHYVYWQQILKDVAPRTGLPMSWGSFGENLTTEGVLEGDIRVGDHLRIGSAEFVVTKPRYPCFKLGIRFNRMKMVKDLLESERTGFYLSVFQEGELGAGDCIEWVQGNSAGPTITDVVKQHRSSE